MLSQIAVFLLPMGLALVAKRTRSRSRFTRDAGQVVIEQPDTSGEVK
jgi:hypothetical protein